MPKFPKVIYVTVEEPTNDEPYMIVHEDEQSAIEAVGDGGKVGVFDFDRALTAQIIMKWKNAP